MKVIGLNNKEYNIDLKKYIVRKDDIKKRSTYHLLARRLLGEIFPGQMILEEMKLPGSRNPSKKSVLFLDFFIPYVRMGVEVHGKQHYEFNAFFHKTKAGHHKSKRRDALKEEWCELNNIDLIILKYSDSTEQWRKQIEC